KEVNAPPGSQREAGLRPLWIEPGHSAMSAQRPVCSKADLVWRFMRTRARPAAAAAQPRSYGVAAAAFAQAAMSGMFAALRVLQEADRSVGNVAAFLAAPQ